MKLRPILIKKDPNGYNNLPYNKEDFQSVIDEVHLSDILDYIITAIEEDWAPKSYWSVKSKEDKMFIGKLQWIIYSYLVHKGLLIVEDCYFEYNKSRIEKYKDRLSYHNPLEKDLYIPIIKRMVDEKCLTDVGGSFYKIGPMYWRIKNLESIID